MSTWKLIHVLSKATGLNERDIGYAGLKDKSATAIQYISIPKQSERDLKNLTTEKIEILEKTYNKAPIKIDLPAPVSPSCNLMKCLNTSLPSI